MPDNPIFEWPREWYRFTQSVFRIQSRSQVTPRSYVAGKSVYGPHAAAWMGQMTVAPQKYTREVHAAQAFFSRLRGQARLIRIGDYRRMKPFNNNVTPTKQAWSDETYFDDGSGWAEYPVPPFGVVARAASRGDSFIVLGGLPASKTALLLRSDTVELRANGVWTSTPNFYEFQVDGNTNADGEMGVEIWPPLRQGFAVGDMAVFDHPMTVMQCIDDDQGFGTNSFPKLTTRSFSLVEAIP